MRQCLKCGSSDMSERAYLSKDDSLNYNPKPKKVFGIKLPLRLHPAIEVCMSCGFIQHFLEENERLKVEGLPK